MMETKAPVSRMVYAQDGFVTASRMLPEETAVAASFNGSTQAVMMATPADLRDFVIGFMTEGIAGPDEIEEITVVETDRGIDVQCWLAAPAEARLAARRRTMAGPVGCGLCGIDSLTEALRSLPPVTVALRLSPAQGPVLRWRRCRLQQLHRTPPVRPCGGVLDPGRGIVALREDVGRHNALDKLAGRCCWRRRRATGWSC